MWNDSFKKCSMRMFTTFTVSNSPQNLAHVISVLREWTRVPHIVGTNSQGHFQQPSVAIDFICFVIKKKNWGIWDVSWIDFSLVRQNGQLNGFRQQWKKMIHVVFGRCKQNAIVIKAIRHVGIIHSGVYISGV